MSSLIARVIRWNVPGLYQQKAHRLLKKITEHPNILTRNENGEAVVYGDAIPGSNFKSLFKSMVSNQQNLNQMGIDEFFRPLRSLGVKKDDISGKPLKIKYSSVAPYSTHQRHSNKTMYEDEEEEDNEEEIRPPSHKHRVNMTRKHHLQACHREGKVMFTNHVQTDYVLIGALDNHLVIFLLTMCSWSCRLAHKVVR